MKITDFGLARAIDDVSVTQTGQLAGTPQFMSPEQAQGQSIDARSDLFSLGRVLYTMCTGRPPFHAETAVAMLRRVTDDDPRSICEVISEIPDWLEGIIFKLLAREPTARFQSAEEVADLLSGHLAHLQHPESTPRPAHIGRLASRADKRAEKKLTWVARILSAAACLSQMAGLAAVYVLIDRLLAAASVSPIAWVFIVGGLVSLPVSLVIAIGSGLAVERLSYRWGMAAVVLALLPVNPVLIVMLPLTMWALVALCRQDVKTLFAAKSKAARKQQPIGKSISNFGITKARLIAFRDKYMVIRGNRISRVGKLGEVSAFLDFRAFLIDSTASPKTIDISTSEDEQFTDCSRSIYQLDGDTLRVCFAQESKLPRPASFDTQGTKCFCYTLKRIQAVQTREH